MCCSTCSSPWSAVNLTDYYLVRHGDYDVPSFFTPAGRYGAVVWRGLIAYLLAVAVQLPFIDQTFYTGALVAPLGGVDISWVVGDVAGLVFYLLALRVPGRDHENGITEITAESSPDRW